MAAAGRVDLTDASRLNLRLTSSPMKGLEFDRVIVPDASAQNFHTEMDRNLLYVACTRTMHRLTLIVAGEPSAFLSTSLAR